MMMKAILFLCVVICLGILCSSIFFAIQSQRTPDVLGLKNEQLLPCPDSPNCVCSEKHTQNDVEHFIQAIKGDKITWDKLKPIIQTQGGKIVQEDADYIHATFRSAVFQYVDDVELRLDEAGSTIHIRSASRMGRSDFGVNRARVETIKKAL